MVLDFVQENCHLSWLRFKECLVGEEAPLISLFYAETILLHD